MQLSFEFSSPPLPGNYNDLPHNTMTGEQLKSQALGQVLGNSSEEWISRGLDAITQLAGKQAWFTADDLPDVVRAGAHHQNAIGALFNTALRKGLIVRGGYVRASRPEAKRRVIATYRGRFNNETQ